MQCKNHPEENGVNTCNQCGCWVCDKCGFERVGRIFCPHCAAQPNVSGAGAFVGPESSGMAALRPEAYSSPKYTGKYISWGLLFLFSVIIPLPGLNYMYMGLIKRGLVAMGTFFGIIYLMSQIGGGLTVLFAFSIPVLILACIFDGFRIRTRINAGEVITDNIDDVTSFIRRNRIVIVGFLLILIAINLAGAILPWLVGLLRRAIPILLAVWVISALLKKPKP